ncbi:MAG: hypothetical protein ACXVB0_05625 [Mucilaginibacter sp.]
MKAIKIFISFIVVGFIMSCKTESSQPIIPIPNGDFESWAYGNLPVQWKTNSCPGCYPAFDTYVVKKDSANVYSGKYAAKFIYNTVYPARAENKFYVPDHPVSLTGYVKTAIHGTDTVIIKIQLFKNNVAVDSGLWAGTSSIGYYHKILVPITQTTAQVDSAKIVIVGGHSKVVYPDTGTILWVDGLSLR